MGAHRLQATSTCLSPLFNCKAIHDSHSFFQPCTVQCFHFYTGVKIIIIIIFSSYDIGHRTYDTNLYIPLSSTLTHFTLTQLQPNYNTEFDA